MRASAQGQALAQPVLYCATVRADDYRRPLEAQSGETGQDMTENRVSRQAQERLGPGPRMRQEAGTAAAQRQDQVHVWSPFVRRLPLMWP